MPSYTFDPDHERAYHQNPVRTISYNDVVYSNIKVPVDPAQNSTPCEAYVQWSQCSIEK